MKYWNKKRGRNNWIKIRGPAVWMPTIFGAIWEKPAIWEAQVWCQQQPSTGKFYRDGRTWEFEKEEDALVFRLKFGV